MDDGQDIIAEAGDITSLPSGHDACVIGDEDKQVGLRVEWVGAGQVPRECCGVGC